MVVCMTSFTSMLGVTSYVRLLNCYTGLRPVCLLVFGDVRTSVWLSGVVIVKKKNNFSSCMSCLLPCSCVFLAAEPAALQGQINKAALRFGT